MTIDECANKAREITGSWTPEIQEKFLRYAELLISWNEKMNLTALTTPPEIFEKHFYDCILALKGQSLSGTVVDVGSGAGFPGVVWKIVQPQFKMILVDPTQKRCKFLQEVITQLSLNDIEVVQQRAEDYATIHREIADVVTARAVAALPILSELCVPLLKVGGTFVVMKGTKGLEEAKEAAYALKELGCGTPEIHEETLPSGDKRVNLYIRKQQPTPKSYPRAYAKIKKHPLQESKTGEKNLWIK